jgi:cytochrome b subunit of formate dehydrogenase
MNTLRELSRSENLKRILDDNNCPVARMRLFSTGIQTNNRIFQYEPITGDKGCLACGNCIDACPVVREKRRFVFTQNQRTSMNLENVVGAECRRCYACVRACPQVSKATKEFATGFRRREKFIHAYSACLIFALATSGIFLFHYKQLLPGWQQLLFQAAHIFAGFSLLLAPLLFALLDRGHLIRAVRNVFRFGAEDRLWLHHFWVFLKSPRRQPLPNWKEFNTYHKLWYAYMLAIVPLLGITGIVNLLGEASVGPLLASIAYWVHSLLAMLTDALVITHLYFKLLRHIVRNVADMGTSFQQHGHVHYPFLYDSKSR